MTRFGDRALLEGERSASRGDGSFRVARSPADWCHLATWYNDIDVQPSQAGRKT